MSDWPTLDQSTIFVAYLAGLVTIPGFILITASIFALADRILLARRRHVAPMSVVPTSELFPEEEETDD